MNSRCRSRRWRCARPRCAARAGVRTLQDESSSSAPSVISMSSPSPRSPRRPDGRIEHLGGEVAAAQLHRRGVHRHPHRRKARAAPSGGSRPRPGSAPTRRPARSGRWIRASAGTGPGAMQAALRILPAQQRFDARDAPGRDGAPSAGSTARTGCARARRAGDAPSPGARPARNSSRGDGAASSRREALAALSAASAFCTSVLASSPFSG